MFSTIVQTQEAQACLTEKRVIIKSKSKYNQFRFYY